MEHQRGLRLTSVGIARRDAGVEDVAAPSLTPQARDGFRCRVVVATMAIDEQQRVPVARSIAPQFEKNLGECARADRQRAGERGVLTTGAEGDRWRHRDSVAPCRRGGGDGHGDSGVGVERQMRAVLFERSERDEQRSPRRVLDLNPLQVSEICHRVLNYRARPPRGEEYALSTTPEQLEETAVEREPEEAPASARAPEEELVVEDLLVEDVSIDGMCGVY
jgi:mycofactocin precursor